MKLGLGLLLTGYVAAGADPAPRPSIWIWPLSSYGRSAVSQDYAEYGYVEGKHHTGMDIGTGGTHPDVHAAASGYITKYVPNGATGCKSTGCPDHGYGNSLAIRHKRKLYSFYAHMDHIDAELLSRIKDKCQEHAGKDQYGAVMDEWDCKNKAVHVQQGDTIGVVGNTTYGCSGPTCYFTDKVLPIHLHFESKKFDTLESPDEPTAFGYSVAHPHFDGWQDPISWVEGSTSIADPYQVTVTGDGEGVNMRVGPNTEYPARLAAHAGATYWAQNTLGSTGGCSMGWYKLRRTRDLSGDPNTYFVANDGYKLPDVWVCRGNNGITYIAP
ncbi:MAG: M23 family metallopeptidase [Alphaproteobacteria bacterium]|nr:M23 family metallopeptidase [Alphaproteobacteria bacterium]